jgi:hypothetical protein
VGQLRAHNQTFASVLADAWNAAIEPSSYFHSATQRPPVRAVAVTAARRGVAGGGVITLAVVASRANVSAIWASLNSTAVATSSNTSFQHLVVGVLHNRSYGFAANLTVDELRVGKKAGQCFVCVDPDVCDVTAAYDTQCGSKLEPPHGTCVWRENENTCLCDQRFTGPHCGTVAPTPAPPILSLTLNAVVGLAAGCLSIIVSCYAVRKTGIARLRKRHRPSINGGRSTGQFDCRDRITISLLCGSFYDKDDNELVDPLVPAKNTSETTRGCLCCRSGDEGGDDEGDTHRGAFASAQSLESRDEFVSAQSAAASSNTHGE